VQRGLEDPLQHGWKSEGKDSGGQAEVLRDWVSMPYPGVYLLIWEDGMMNPSLVNIMFK